MNCKGSTIYSDHNLIKIAPILDTSKNADHLYLIWQCKDCADKVTYGVVLPDTPEEAEKRFPSLEK